MLHGCIGGVSIFSIASTIRIARTKDSMTLEVDPQLADQSSRLLGLPRLSPENRNTLLSSLYHKSTEANLIIPSLVFPRWAKHLSFSMKYVSN